jgi:glycosyltransferase involved in cell wall biosynthesis
MNVLFVTQYGYLAASSRTRVFQYLPLLHAQGVNAEVLTVLPDLGISGSQVLVTANRWRKLPYYLWAAWRTVRCGLTTWWRLPRYDLLFVQKIIFPAPIRWLLERKKQRMIYDFDDAIFTTEVRHPNWLSSWKERRNAAGLPAALRMADHVLVENEYTREYAVRFCPKVAVITGPIDTRRYVRSQSPSCEGTVLGWIGSATTLPYLEHIAEPLRELGARYDGICLSIVGASGFRIEGLRVESTPWLLETEVEKLSRFHVGLMPLPDDPWTRGKGGYKLLQYMSMGLPVVSSPVGINCRLVDHGQNGFLAADHREWLEYLGKLIENPQLQLEMGARGRATVEREYSLETSSAQLMRIMRETAQLP